MWDLLFGAMLSVFVAGKSQFSGVQPLASHAFSMGYRYQDPWVSEVFADNILLTLAYMRQTVRKGEQVDWSTVREPFHWSLDIEPGSVVTYHANVLPKYERIAIPLTNVYFNGSEGFRSDGYLVGDGTCQLASLLSWVARDAGLTVEAPVNHDFAAIPEVPKEQGVSIYSHPTNKARSATQNLYIQNDFSRVVRFAFHYDGETLRISASKLL